jgi:hypothetical protein
MHDQSRSLSRDSPNFQRAAVCRGTSARTFSQAHKMYRKRDFSSFSRQWPALPQIRPLIKHQECRMECNPLLLTSSMNALTRASGTLRSSVQMVALPTLSKHLSSGSKPNQPLSTSLTATRRGRTLRQKRSPRLIGGASSQTL